MNIRNKMLISSALASITARAFNSGAPGWKKTADGTGIEMKDGNPIWIDQNGAEQVMQSTAIADLRSEAKSHREARETAETKLAAFKDLDPTVARKAIDDMKKIDTKKLIDAGEVDKVRDEISKQFTTQLTEKDNALQTLQSQLDNMEINNVFANSEFIREQIAIPRDMFEAATRKHFKKGKDGVEAYDKAGNRIMSKKNMGQYADPDEALQLIVEAHPQKDTILRASDHSGSGGGNGGGRTGQRTMKRSEFDAIPDPAKKAQLAQQMGKGELTIVE